MPQLIHIKEVLYKELWHAWIADTRPGGLGTSKELTKYSDAIRLFTTDIGDIHRTNMRKFGGGLFSSHEASIHKIGVFASFSNPIHYKSFFRSTYFKFIVNKKSQVKFPALEIPVPPGWPRNDDGSPKESFPHGFMGWIKLAQPIKIEGDQEFYGVIKSNKSFVHEMRKIETKQVPNAYAEIKLVLGTDYTRDVI